MKILFLTITDIEKPQYLGVRKKVNNQVDALRKLGHDVYYGFCEDGKFVIKSGDIVEEYPIKKGITRYRKGILETLKKKNCYDAIYLRYPVCIDYMTYLILRQFKDKTAMLEIPTYPVGYEMGLMLKRLLKGHNYKSYIIHILSYSMHMIFSRRLNRILNCVVTFMPYDRIWGVNTVVIDNGISLDECKLVKKKTTSDNSIRMLFVGSINAWHGLDRLIDGLSQYYRDSPKRKVLLTIVGDGPCCKELQMLTEKCNLKEYVCFKNALSGEHLYDEYCSTDIGIGSLGMHRINMMNGSTLKIKEYCAMGIPFVYAYNEREIDDDFKYALKIEGHDNPVRIERLIAFYDGLKFGDKDAMNLHEFAEEKFQWKDQMEKVLSFINRKE